ncbi:hypothetical protein N826_38795 [Skermanella aerolata KACC 11604]|nr:hypothetical protein N826_38795 [Skermanella aerolata KACC 11604]
MMASFHTYLHYDSATGIAAIPPAMTGSTLVAPSEPSLRLNLALSPLRVMN